MYVQQRKRHRQTDACSIYSVDSTVTLTAANQILEHHIAATATVEQTNDSAAAAAAAVSPCAAPHSNSETAASVHDSKRTFSCRICGVALSSASNRIRHERAKHKTSAAAVQSSSIGSKRSLQEVLAVADVVDEATDRLDEAQPMDLDSSSTKSNDSEPGQLVELESSNLQLVPPVLDFSSVEGLRSLLKEEDLQACCYPFLVWLSQPPVTQCEALIKARRVKSLAQLQPVKSNLRFIFALLYERETLAGVEMQALTQLAVCQSLFDAMTARQVGSGRIHAVFLLLKKVLVYLSSQESTIRRQFIQPTTYESFFFVDNICSDSSHRRKQESRNRALLGVKTSQLLHKSQPMPSHQPFVVPVKWTSSAAAAVAVTVAPLQKLPPAAAAAASAAVTVIAERSKANDNQVPSNELTKEELQQVTKGCVAFLSTYTQPASSSTTAAAAAAAVSSSAIGNASDLQADRLFMAHLVTATLCLGLAPRSQVLKQLRIGSSFVKQADGHYWVKILAEMSKNGRPTMFAISAQLTAAFDFYLEVIRPRLLNQLQGPASDIHDFLFVKRNGSAPRADFSSCTCLITQRLIGRPVNAHAFRAAVVTAFYETGASQSEMDVLANIMAHDPATAKSFYFRPQQAAAALQTNDRMTDLLMQD